MIVGSTQIIYSLIARDGASRAFHQVSRSMDDLERKSGSLGTAMKAGALAIGTAAVAGGIAVVRMAADFQTAMTRVRTGAGESAANMKLVSQGVLTMAGQVGVSTQQLTAGLYTVESAGYHGADALNVLRNAAMGAKVGAADLGTVTDAVTTALNAYKLGAGQAAEVTNALIATESEGKTNLEALAGSLSNVLPTAAAAKVGLNEILGAMATMTSQGTPAAQAATYLRQVIGQLSNPSAKAATEMANLGLSAVQVGQELGTKGLAATLTTLTDAIEKKMGPAGTVLIQHLQGAAKNTSSFQRALANLPPTQQTYIGALATMVGGTKSMQAALELTGPHMHDFIKNTDGISEHVKAGGKTIEGWSAVEKTFNQKLAEATDGLQALAIQLGTKFLPAGTAFVGFLGKTVIPAAGRFATFLTSTAVPAVERFGSSLVNRFVPVAQIKKDFDALKSNVSDFMAGLFAKAPKAPRLPVPLLKAPPIPSFLKIPAPPPSAAKAAGDQMRELFSKGISSGLAAINWGSVGKTLGNGLGKALSGLASLGGKLFDALGKAISGIDWVSLGEIVGGQALPFVIGFANNLLAPLFSGSFWSKHWLDVLKFAVMLIPIGRIAGMIGKVFEKIPFLKAFAPIFKGLEGLGGFVEKGLGKILKPFVSLGKAIWKGVIDGYLKVFPEAQGKIDEFLGKAAINIVGYVGRFAATGERLIKGLGEGILKLGGKVGEWIGKVIGWLVKPFATANEWLLQKGADFLSGLLSGTQRIVRTVGTWLLDNVIKPVLLPFQGADEWLLETGGHLLSGLKSGVVDAIKGIGSWIKSNLVDPVVNAVKHWFGIHSPSTVFAELGGHLVAGLMKGMAATGGTAIAQLVFGDLPSALGAIVGKGLVAIGSLPGKALSALGSLGSKAWNLLGGLFGGGGGGNSSTQSIGQTLAAAYGWTGGQWSALKALWNGESGWNPRALNASSGAYGIPQALPAGKMASAGADWRTNPATQIKWGLSYIHSVYGSPAAAYAKWLSRSPHWYAAGTPSAASGWAVVGERGPELVHFNGGERVLSNRQSRQALAAQPPQVTVRVFIGDQELTDLVRVEVDEAFDQLTGALDAGAGWHR